MHLKPLGKAVARPTALVCLCSSPPPRPPQLRDWLQKRRPLHVLQEHVPGRPRRRRLGALQGQPRPPVVAVTPLPTWIFGGEKNRAETKVLHPGSVLGLLWLVIFDALIIWLSRHCLFVALLHLELMSQQKLQSEFVSKVPDVLIESLQHSAGLKILFWWLHQRATARAVAVSSLLPSKLRQIKMAPLQFLIYVRNLGKTTRAALAFTSTDESEQRSMREPTIFCCCARRLIPACHICRAP